MSDADHFVGFWKVIDCTQLAVTVDSIGIRGTIFQLSKTGDVTWKAPEGAVSIPLFKCDTYVLLQKKLHSSNFTIRFASYKGHIIKCTVKTCDPSMSVITINIGWCLLVCKKLKDVNQDPFDLPFSFLPALQDSYFSDLSIKSENNKEFKVHTTILKLSAPEIDWSGKVTPLSDLSEDVTFAILHFLYAQCLPSDVTEGTVYKVISAASQIPGLSPLVSLCHRYIRNLTIKNQIFSLISDVQGCASQIECFTYKQFSRTFNAFTLDPAKLWFAVKNSIREAAVAVAKILMICDLFTKHKNELSKVDINEIILHAKSRVPILMNQFENFLITVKTIFSNLLPSQRPELARYLAPEFDTIYDSLSSLLIKLKTVLEIMVAESEKKEENGSEDVVENLEQYTDRVLNTKELSLLQEVVCMISCVLLPLERIKENFRLGVNGNKIRFIFKILEQLVEKLPIFVLGLEEFTSAAEKKLQWNEFQFFFKVGTSEMSEVMKKLLLHKELLQDFMTELCYLVQRDAFTQSLLALGFLESSSTVAQSSEVIQKEDDVHMPPDHVSHVLNSKNYFSTPPPANQNCLSEAACELLQSGQASDMVFEIMLNETDAVQGNTEKLSAESSTEVYRIAAHRVIVASRCDWFRRALLSGMQEDINRKIQVYNTSPFLFSIFLKYLYSGTLNFSALSVDQISELLLLSDRYEMDCLKQMCEFGLQPYLDVDTVLYFYNMADKFSAKILKSACEQFVVEHPEIVDSELFEELPEDLQSEVYDVVICGKPQTLDKAFTDIPCNMGDIKEMFANIRINRDLPTPENDDVPLAQDFPRLQAALEQLREIVGQEASHYQLVQLILASDYDVNRALNFYYSHS